MLASSREEELWCTFPFTTRLLNIGATGKTILFILDVFILVLNLVSSTIGVFTLKTTRHFKVKPSLWIISYLFINDAVFAACAQLFYAIKLAIPDIGCSFDLAASFIVTWLANTSLVMVMFIAVVRYISTKYLFRTSQIVDRLRAKLMIFVALLIASLLSSTLIIGSSLKLFYLINFPTTISDIFVPIIIPVIYYRAMRIAMERRHTSTLNSKSITVATLRKCSYYTLATFLPTRIGFFISSTYKMVKATFNQSTANNSFQLIHSVCYLVFCLSPFGNALAYYMNNAHARMYVSSLWKRLIKTASHSAATATVTPESRHVSVSPASEC